jgi:glycine/D-amino acid oxidase-like deaminating enzyme
MSDVVVLAAGVGCAHLGQIPLLHRPGQIAFAHPVGESATKKSPTLTRILVDTLREVHVLQRSEENFVIGGGGLEVGGSGGVALSTASAGRIENRTSTIQDQLLGGARQLVPGAIGKLIKTESALRPIPSDGLPAVGYIKAGLYTVVSHSGVTLSPILAALAASELANDCCIPMLESFRPTRFVQ